MRSDQLRSVRHGATCVVYLGPEYNSLDDQVLDEVEHFLLTCIDPPDVKNLVVDLSNTTFFGSRFIEVLFRAYNRIKRKEGRFGLSGLRGHTEEVIYVSKLQRLWELVPTPEEAVRRFKGGDSPPEK